MLPLGDDNTDRKTTPIMTFALSMVNFLVFFLEIIGGDAFIQKWAFVPSRFFANPLPNIMTIFTSMFMHAGWFHLISNMIYLWILGIMWKIALGIKVSHLLFACRGRCKSDGGFLQPELKYSYGWRLRGNCGRAGRLCAALSNQSGAGFAFFEGRVSSCVVCDRVMVRSAALQRHWLDGNRGGYWRRRLSGACRGVHFRLCDDFVLPLTCWVKNIFFKHEQTRRSTHPEGCLLGRATTEDCLYGLICY